MTPAAAHDVLDFWIGDAVSGDADALRTAFARWFNGGRAVDEEIRARFDDMIDGALAGDLAAWEADLHARLALILLLDQFPRNAYRRTARAFAGDARALALAHRTVAQGEDEALAPVERFFLLMPYQHAEDAAVQQEGVRLFEALARTPADAPVAAMLESGVAYARQHRDIIVRFGRFPYRNDVLGRDTTDAEAQWLAASPERFGQ